MTEETEVAALKEPVRLLDRNTLLVLHALSRSTEHGAAQEPHIIGLLDGRMVVKLPNGGSLLPLSSGNLQLRALAEQAEGGATGSSGIEAHDHLLRYRVRGPHDADVARSSRPRSARGHVLARSRMWEICIGWQLPGTFPAFGEAAAVDRRALDDAALRRGIVHTLTRADASSLLRWQGGRGLCLALGTASDEDRRAGALLLEKAAQAGADAAAARIRQLRLRAVVAGSLEALLHSWPPNVTQLVSNTWWKPWLRPRTWAPTRQAEAQARKEERRRRAGGVQQSQLAAAPPSQAVQQNVRDQSQEQMAAQVQAQVAAQSTAQAAADMRDRMQKQAQAKEWCQRQWLQSHVRSALFYALRTSDVQDRIPIMRATVTPFEELGPRPRDSPQGRFPAGLPDAVQEIFPQLPPELAQIPEGGKRPDHAGKDGQKRRPPLTAQVLRIRGGPTTATAFSTLATFGPREAKAPELAAKPVEKVPQVPLVNAAADDDVLE